MKTIAKIAVATVILPPIAIYLLQIGIVCSWRIFPIKKTEQDGKIYKITRGFRDKSDFFPVLGLFSALPHSQVTLTIEDKATGQIQELGFDEWRTIVFVEYREVFVPNENEG